MRTIFQILFALQVFIGLTALGMATTTTAAGDRYPLAGHTAAFAGFGFDPLTGLQIET
jgi:hypothetical protein